MKIAMVGLRGIPAKSGGVEVAVDNLSSQLVRLGADITVYCRSQYCPEHLSEYKGVKLRYLPTLNTKYTEATVHTFISSVDSLFRDYDIVHFHAMGNNMFSFLPRISGKKTMLTLHGLDYEREKWGKVAKMYLRLNERLSLFFPNRIISVSEKMKGYFKSTYGKDIAYIPNGVNIEKRMDLSKLNRFNLKPGYFLSIGRIVPEKGLQYLIDAFKGVKTERQLVIVGDCAHTEKYLAELKLLAKEDNRIIFTGPLYGEEKQEAYSNAFSFVLPSTIEGMPIVLLEAMSYGLYSIISDIAENLEAAKGLALSFRSKDTDDLREKLNYMIKHPIELEKKRDSCINYVRKELSWKKIAAQHLIVYEEALKNG